MGRGLRQQTRRSQAPLSPPQRLPPPLPPPWPHRALTARRRRLRVARLSAPRTPHAQWPSAGSPRGRLQSRAAATAGSSGRRARRSGSPRRWPARVGGWESSASCRGGAAPSSHASFVVRVMRPRASTRIECAVAAIQESIMVELSVRVGVPGRTPGIAERRGAAECKRGWRTLESRSRSVRTLGLVFPVTVGKSVCNGPDIFRVCHPAPHTLAHRRCPLPARLCSHPSRDFSPVNTRAGGQVEVHELGINLCSHGRRDSSCLVLRADSLKGRRRRCYCRHSIGFE